MVKTHHYSQTKFTSFSQVKQQKVLVEMLSALEKNIADREFAAVIIPSILECLAWAEDEIRLKMSTLKTLGTEISPHRILQIINPIIRNCKHNYDETEPEIYRLDGLDRHQHRKVPHPITVIASNIRSQYNLGAICRTAECVSANHIYLCGISNTTPRNAFSKSAMGTEHKVPHTMINETRDAIELCRKQGLAIIALETAANAISLFEYKPVKSVAVILGNEALGIEADILKLADEVLSIPVFGWKNSLNVSNAFAVAAYYLSGVCGN